MLSQWLKESNYTVVFTGAGMSTESGLPDFRSKNSGMWKQEDPSKIATTEALNENVERFFEFYRQRVIGVNECKPHKGYHTLAKWEKDGIIQSIITQNVDGFHKEAGSENVAELHGTMKQVHCHTCGKEYGNEMYADQKFHCECGGKLRPSVVLFGEMLPEEPFMKAAEESEKAELFIVLGSSLTVSPANQFPLIAKQNRAKLVIINMEPTEFDMYADLVINDRKIGEVLQESQPY
ncbi:NAD-dependent deacylase [Bacillus sp. FJAT-50079]|uniref:NAD-dependent deacylase n=1 Tax=Bacillus sp. FJAT-50079 TaxID=2833577 RepID=UPI001BC90CC8|nr:NAD-dependent deacylase [Bacillus sp. FJAT-50079]MBS4209555.1 NAD-dependent deacylase [Bacillus sp. FJAT-50079]